MKLRQEYDISANTWTDISPESKNVQQHCSAYDSSNKRSWDGGCGYGFVRIDRAREAWLSALNPCQNRQEWGLLTVGFSDGACFQPLSNFG